MVSYLDKILGQLVDMWRLEVGVPPALITETLQLLKSFHRKRKSFTVKEWKRPQAKSPSSQARPLGSSFCCPKCISLLQQGLATTKPTSLGQTHSSTSSSRMQKQLQATLKSAPLPSQMLQGKFIHATSIIGTTRPSKRSSISSSKLFHRSASSSKHHLGPGSPWPKRCSI